MNPSVHSTAARPLRGFVLGLAIALAGGASLTAFAGPDGGSHGMGGRHHGAPGFMMDGPGGGRHMERMLDDVQATEAQRTQIRQIWQSAAADLKAQRETGRSLREQQMELFAQPTVDASAVEALRQKMLAEHDRSSKRITQAMLDSSRVLTPQQRAQLAEKMKARRDLMQRQMQERRQLDKQTG
jgi:Spy/CpxP family protein refolding chaperone